MKFVIIVVGILIIAYVLKVLLRVSTKVVSYVLIFGIIYAFLSGYDFESKATSVWERFDFSVDWFSSEIVESQKKIFDQLDNLK